MGLTGNPVAGRQHSYPTPKLHVDRHVQAQHTLNSLTVNARLFRAHHHYVYCIAGDEADGEKDYDGKY